jgi:hypothetical protein
MTNLFSVVGEHRDDPNQLLLLGSDGIHYATSTRVSDPVPIEPGEDWLIDERVPDWDDVSYHGQSEKAAQPDGI